MRKERTIRLQRHFDIIIEDLIASGKYADEAAVIEDALRLLEAREAKLDALRDALIEGERSGPATPLDMTDVKRRARARAAKAA